MTFQEFRNSIQILSLNDYNTKYGDPIWGEEKGNISVYTYANSPMSILRRIDSNDAEKYGRYQLILGNCEYNGDNLLELECRLYVWACDEWLDDCRPLQEERIDGTYNLYYGVNDINDINDGYHWAFDEWNNTNVVFMGNDVREESLPNGWVKRTPITTIK